MSSHEYLKVEDVIDSLSELGGEANWQDIQDRIEEKRSHPCAPYKDRRNYLNTMFQLAQVHCKGYAKFNGQELFRKISNDPPRFQLISSPKSSPTILRRKSKSKTLTIETPIETDWLERVITANDLADPPSRVESKSYRIIRDTLMARKIKKIHNFQCQICHETPIKLKSGFYAEAHHIKPLGEPYNGPDVPANIICVCPNCHVLLDYAAIEIDERKLIEKKGHKISKEYIEFHNHNIHQNK